MTTEVAKLLLKKGERVAVLSLPENLRLARNPLPTGVQRITLENDSDATILTILQKIGLEQIGNFIHLHPHFSFEDGNFAKHADPEKSIIKIVFFLAKHLSKSLQKFSETHRSVWLTVSRIDGNFGLSNSGTSSIFSSGLNGITKSLNLEWSGVFCRSFDLSPEFSATEGAKYVFAELHDANHNLPESAQSLERRSRLITVPTEVQDSIQKSTTISSESVFLVSGGAKGVTAECVKKLAQTHQCKFILLGRSKHTGNEADWAKGIDNPAELKKRAMFDLKNRGEKPIPKVVQKAVNTVLAEREITETLAHISKSGGEAIYVSADVTDATALRKVLPEAVQKLGKITGVIHGAGVLADKLIEKKTEWDFDMVYDVKIKGLIALLENVDVPNLEQLVLFSSVAGFYGNFGQTDYSMANEILSKSAHLMQKNHPNCHAVSINWGAWDSGMVSPQLKKMFESHGISLIPTEGGAWMAVNELTTEYQSDSQVIVGSILPIGSSLLGELKTHKIHRKMVLENNPFLHHHSIGGNPVLPIVNAMGWISNNCAELYPDYQLFEVQNAKLYKGLVFDGTAPKNYVLEAKETRKTASEIIFDAKVYSPTERGLPRYHYGARVVLRKNMVENSNETPVFNHQIETPIEIDGKELYESKILFHDTHFQGIVRVLSLNEKGIVAECRKPQIPIEEQGQFPVRSTNAFLNDIQYQALVVWVRKQMNAYSLPLNTEVAQIYAPIPFDETFFVTVKIEEATPFKARAEILVSDKNGKLFMHTKGAEVTVSKELAWA